MKMSIIQSYLFLFVLIEYSFSFVIRCQIRIHQLTMSYPELPNTQVRYNLFMAMCAVNEFLI